MTDTDHTADQCSYAWCVAHPSPPVENQEPDDDQPDDGGIDP